jgi:hypothetical protein
MTMNNSTRLKALAMGAITTVVLAGGASAVLVPSVAGATVAKHGVNDRVGDDRGTDIGLVASHGLDDKVGAPRHAKTADDAIGHARIGSDDSRPGNVRHSRGSDDPAGHARHGADDTQLGNVRHGRGSDDPAGHA